MFVDHLIIAYLVLNAIQEVVVVKSLLANTTLHVPTKDSSRGPCFRQWLRVSLFRFLARGSYDHEQNTTRGRRKVGVRGDTPDLATTTSASAPAAAPAGSCVLYALGRAAGYWKGFGGTSFRGLE